MTVGDFLKGGEAVDSRIDYGLTVYAGNNYVMAFGHNVRLLASDENAFVFDHFDISTDLPIVVNGNVATAKLEGGATLTIRKKAGWLL